MSVEPNIEWSRKEFYELAVQPDFPDEMEFQVNREKADGTFSMEAIDELSEQFHTFLLARILGRMDKTGEPPLKLRASVKLNWNPGDPRIDPEVGPFYRIGNDEGITPLDGNRRKWGAD